MAIVMKVDFQEYFSFGYGLGSDGGGINIIVVSFVTVFLYS
jgi:hypothetical protein